MSDILEVLSAPEVDSLLTLLHECLPESIVIYNWILKHQEWSEKLEGIQVQILSAQGRSANGVVAVGICQGVAEKLYGVVFATEENDEVLRKCLMETKLIPWAEFSHFTGVLERHALIMSDVLKSKSFKTSESEISQSFLLHIPIIRALQQSMPALPENYVSSPVNLSHFPEAINILDGYKRTTRTMFEWNLSSGVFRIRDDGSRELVAMNVQAEYGGISILQTAPEYQQQGFGTVVLTSLTRLMAQERIYPHGHVKKDNYKSLALFKKCGYKVLGKSYWIFVEKI